MTMVGRRRRRAGSVAVLLCVALPIAGCGSASSRAASGGSEGAVVIGTSTGPAGTYLSDATGRTLYLWVGDGAGKSNCSGDCARSWPPLTTGRAPSATDGVKAAGLGTVTRSDGSKQVTYVGHPLYYFANDIGGGSAIGQGSDSFGAKWWLVAPSGGAITTVPPSAGY
jgi:predicted lipoprotein with Yx(FWY)xxD motif